METGVYFISRRLLISQTSHILKRELISSTVNTARLILVNSTRELLEGILKGENVIAEMLDIRMANPWSEFGPAPFEYALNKIKDTPSDSVCWSWLPILVSENTLIGNCGYKGPPVDGAVEIGYEVAVAYRNQGFATEIAKALVENAICHPDVDTVIAHTLPEENDSVRVLRKCSFHFVSTVEDPDDGLIWKWQLDKGESPDPEYFKKPHILILSNAQILSSSSLTGLYSHQAHFTSCPTNHFLSPCAAP